MIENIAFDESRNTGDDLLNKDQKVFTLASNNFSNDELEELFSFFDDTKEAHFVQLKKSERGRRLLLDFINKDLITEKNIQLSVCHKEFAVVAQLVDKIYEPHFNYFGIDLYKNNINVTLANMIYFLGNIQWDRDRYLNFISAFVKMMRSKERSNFVEFGESIDELRKGLNKMEVELVIFPLLRPEIFLDELRSSSNKYSLDFTLSIFLVHCDIWHKFTGNRLAVNFDNSKQIDYHKEYIDWLTSLKTSKVDVGYNGKTMTFPAQIESLNLINSTNYLSVQCSDLLAGTIAFFYNNTNKKQEAFRQQIRESRLFNLSNYFNIWPSKDDLNIRYQKIQGSNILDFLLKNRENFP